MQRASRDRGVVVARKSLVHLSGQVVHRPSSSLTYLLFLFYFTSRRRHLDLPLLRYANKQKQTTLVA